MHGVRHRGLRCGGGQTLSS
ncbi:unnamed protein product, partial [Didymodactylos carnosus]